MRIPRINLAGVFGVFKHVKDLPKLIGICQDVMKYLKLLDLIKDSLKVPAANLLFEMRKAVESLKDRAAATDLNQDGDFTNDPDDKIWAGMISGIDAVLDFFHLTDDYQKLVELDKKVTPQ